METRFVILCENKYSLFVIRKWFIFNYVQFINNYEFRFYICHGQQRMGNAHHPASSDLILSYLFVCLVSPKKEI